MNDNHHLYRKAYFSAQSTRSEGRVLISPAPGMTIFACLSSALVCALIAFLILGTYTRKARLEGVVMPSTGVVKVVARTEGFVRNLLVKEGDIVSSGQLLYRLSGERYDGMGTATLATLKLSMMQQYQMLEQQQQQEMDTNIMQLRGLQRRESQLKDELRSANEALKLALRQAMLTKSVMERYQLLVGNKYVSEIEFHHKQIELAVTEANVENNRQVQHRLQRELTEIETEQESLQQQGLSRKAELDRLLQGIHQQKIELQAQAEVTLTSPVAGHIAAVMVREGQTVNQNELLLTVVPLSSHLQIELYATSKSVGFIKPNQRVGLRFAAYPYEKFGVQYGTTRAITRTSLSSVDVMPRNPIVWKENEGHYRVIVEPDKSSVTVYGRQEPLRTGMTVAADVELESRHLYEWLLEPLWSLQGKI
ncbi:MAG: HlyD family secretion protein [Silvania sp.]